MIADPKEIIEKNKAVYNRIAKQFSDTRAYVWEDLKPLKRFAKTGDRVLDVGCGNGRLLQLFDGLAISYMGTDQSEELIRLAQEKFPDQNFQVAEMQKLPFEDGSFDVVFCIAALQHLPDEGSCMRALSEMKRIVRQNGCIVLTNWNLISRWAKEKYGEGVNGNFVIPWKDAEGKNLGERFYHGFTLEELEGLGAKVGLRVQENFFFRKGEKSDGDNGENIVTVFVRE